MPSSRGLYAGSTERKPALSSLWCQRFSLTPIQPFWLDIALTPVPLLREANGIISIGQNAKEADCCKTISFFQHMAGWDKQNLWYFFKGGFEPSRTRKKLAATASCREGVYNRTGEPSVTFCVRGGARKRAEDLFSVADKKISRSKANFAPTWEALTKKIPSNWLLQSRNETFRCLIEFGFLVFLFQLVFESMYEDYRQN